VSRLSLRLLTFSLFCHRGRFVTGSLKIASCRSGTCRLARIERDDHPLTLEIDFYIFHAGNFIRTGRNLRTHSSQSSLRSRSRSFPGFRDRPVPEKNGSAGSGSLGRAGSIAFSISLSNA